MTLPKWATQEVREKLGEMLSTIHRWENGRGKFFVPKSDLRLKSLRAGEMIMPSETTIYLRISTVPRC